MTQNERWKVLYNVVMEFMEKNQRNPSKHFTEEKLIHHWAPHNGIILNSGQQKEERKELFEKLLALAEKCKHVNQYV